MHTAPSYLYKPILHLVPSSIWSLHTYDRLTNTYGHFQHKFPWPILRVAPSFTLSLNTHALFTYMYGHFQHKVPRPIFVWSLLLHGPLIHNYAFLHTCMAPSYIWSLDPFYMWHLLLHGPFIHMPFLHTCIRPLLIDGPWTHFICGTFFYMVPSYMYAPSYKHVWPLLTYESFWRITLSFTARYKI